MHHSAFPLALSLLATLASSPGAGAADTKLRAWASMETPTILSEEVPGGAAPGQTGDKGRLVVLSNTTGGLRDGRLVTFYVDANGSQPLWNPKSETHLPRDVFSRYSDDGGETWSAPVNISNTAGSYSAVTDHDGDGVAEPYYSDSDKPTVFNHGDVVVVTWVDKYLPETTWTFGDSGESAVQGRATYEDATVSTGERVVPYSGLYAAISYDGGESFAFGDVSQHAPPLQITWGRRDAIQDVHRGSGKRWVITWQEDPEGLQPGEAEGPGDGASGSTASDGTDVWYTYTTDIAVNPQALVTNRVPLTNHSAYDRTQTNGFPLAGVAGAIEPNSATRANLFLVNDGGTFRTLVGYEERIGEGKRVRYHAFPFNAPVTAGTAADTSGSAGTMISDPNENARRTRFVVQAPNGVDPAICIFWRQGIGGHGGSADIVAKVSTTVDEASVAAASPMNLSSNAPIATPANWADATSVNSMEDAKAHRALMRGPMIALGYSYTPDLDAQLTSTDANYDFWVVRSFDGGVTWTAPKNLTHLPKKFNVKEPRLVGPAKSGTEDPDAFVVAYGVETNVVDAEAFPEPLDIRILRTRDGGETYSTTMSLATSPDPEPEFESQLRVDDDASNVDVVWMEGAETVDVLYSRLTNDWFTPGDRLRFDLDGGNSSIGFSGLNDMKLRLTFPEGDDVRRVHVEVLHAPQMSTVLDEVVAEFTLKAGKKKVRETVLLPNSGEYLLRVTHLDGPAGTVVVDTGRKLPPKAKARSFVARPEDGALTRSIHVLALPRASLDLRLKSLKGKPAGPSFWYPDGSSYDLDAFDDGAQKVRRYLAMPLESVGRYTLDLDFSGHQGACRVVLKPHQPHGDAVLDVY